MNTLSLVVLAAGMGRRYGGLKQIDPVGPNGELIIDYSLADALDAGFTRAVFVIRRDIETDFERLVRQRWRERMDVALVFQDEAAAEGCSVERTKPWGTGHAVLACEGTVDGPFAVINADDYYGAASFRVMAEFMQKAESSDKLEALAKPLDDDTEVVPPVSKTADNLKFGGSGSLSASRTRQAGSVPTTSAGVFARASLECALIGFRLADTLTPHGAVARGICRTNDDGMLLGIEECTGIRLQNGQPVPESGMQLDGSECVSMNAWAFPHGIMPLLRNEWNAFAGLHGKDPDAEFYLPSAIDRLMQKKMLSVRVLEGGGPWFGVTHRADRDEAVRRLAEIRPSAETVN